MYPQSSLVPNNAVKQYNCLFEKINNQYAIVRATVCTLSVP